MAEPEVPPTPPGSVQGSSAGGSRAVLGRVGGLTGARLAAAAVSGVWYVVAARRLSLAEFGDLSLILVLLAIAVSVSDGGLQIVLNDHVARAGTISERVLRAVVARRSAYAVACGAAMVGLYALAGATSPAAALIALGSLFGTVVYQTQLTAYRGLGRVAADGVNEVASRLLVLVAGAGLLAAGYGVVGAVTAYALADVVSAVAITVLLRRRVVVPDDHLPPPDLRIRSTAPLALAIVTTVVYARVDLYFVVLLSGADAGGLYGASYRLFEVALMPMLVLGQLVLAHVAPVHGRARRRETNRFLGLAAIVGATVMAVGVALVGPVMPWLFGPEFADAVPMARVLFLAALPSALVLVLAPLAGVEDRAGFARASVACLGVNVALNLVLIPPLGGMGAAWATVVGQLLFAALLYAAVVRSRSTGRNGEKRDAGMGQGAD